VVNLTADLVGDKRGSVLLASITNSCLTGIGLMPIEKKRKLDKNKDKKKEKKEKRKVETSECIVEEVTQTVVVNDQSIEEIENDDHDDLSNQKKIKKEKKDKKKSKRKSS
jgi:hypothetical protein